MSDWQQHYTPPVPDSWHGRVDDPDDPLAQRWHQVVSPVDLREPAPLPAGERCFVLLGFPCDLGVTGNLGRPGTARGPRHIRSQLANLPWLAPGSVSLCDGGDVWPAGEDLATSQAALAAAVTRVVDTGGMPLVLGGGHELALGHYLGLEAAIDGTLGIVNFDAHLDLRPFARGGSSGTMFAQIAARCAEVGKRFSYGNVGAQLAANTPRLFRTAEELGAFCLLARELGGEGTEKAARTLHEFAAGVDHLYVTICADVFGSAHAPGVSSPQPFGLSPETVLELLRPLWSTGKVVGFDVAEVSPRFDADNQTAKLAAILIFALVNTLSGADRGVSAAGS